MKNFKFGLLLLFVVLVSPLVAQTEWYNSAQARIDTLRKGNFTVNVKNAQGAALTDSVRIVLRKHSFPWGYAVDLYETSVSTIPTTEDWYKAVMLKFCNFGVNGNSFKWSGIQANQNQLTYSGFENTYSWFKRFGWEFRAHTLLWGGYNETDYHCVPQWVMNLKSTPKLMYDTCMYRITREVTRYKGIVKEYDVINEPLHATTLQSIVGDSINWNCFKTAYKADPTARFFINDYNVIEYGNETTNYYNLITKLLQKGAPITGIGAQCHIGSTVDIANFKSRFDQLGQLGLPIKITEFDMNAINSTEQQYADEISKMMRLCFSHPAVEGFIFWGMTEPTWADGIINVARQDKTTRIAADSVYNLIHEKWHTDVKGQLDANGSYTFNGYYGDYDVEVKENGVWSKFDIVCKKADKGKTYDLSTLTASASCPELKSVKVVEPNQMLLTFNKDMSNPSGKFKQFKIFDSKTNYTKSAALKSDDPKTIVLTLLASVGKQDYLPVAFIPESGTYTSADGGILAPFGYQLADGLKFGLLSTATSTNGKQVLLNFDNPLVDSTIILSEFVVKVNYKNAVITSFTTNTDKRTLALNLETSIAKSTDVITVTYGSGSLKRMDGCYITAFKSKSVTNTVVVPKLVSASTNLVGSMIYLNFDSNMGKSTGLDTLFTVSNSKGVTYSVKKVETSSTTKTRIFLTLTTSISKGETITVKYKGTALYSANEVPVAAFTASVTNSSTTALETVVDPKVRFYPNPLKDQLTIEQGGEYSNLTVVDLDGKVLMQKMLKGLTSETVSVSTLSRGVYMMILSNDEKTVSEKMVKE